ncbi:MAG: type 1 glutamine amidotransferase [Puniceicoccaceae bacterium]
MRLTVLQHLASEGPGRIATWAGARGHQLEYVRFFESESLPPIQSVEGVILLGGSMNVGEVDRHPWLLEESVWLSEILHSGRIPVFGVCLGAQLIAAALGARVYPNEEPEVGWMPVSFDWEALNDFCATDLPHELAVLHWHEQTFELPDAARRFATNEVTKNQGFVLGEKPGRVLGLQFHLEVDAAIVKRWFNAVGESGMVGRYVHQSEKVLRMSDAAAEETEPVLNRLLDWCFEQ